MTRSLTLKLPPLRRFGLWVATLIVAAALLAVGVRIGLVLFAPGEAASLGGQLQEVQTTGGTYVGRIVSDNGHYIRLAQPAIVRVQPAASAEGVSQFVVQMLAAEPFGIGSDLLINRDQILFMGSVASDSDLAGAYREVSGQ
jgi:hypothetical protein